jgi:hypothetical protein
MPEVFEEFVGTMGTFLVFSKANDQANPPGAQRAVGLSAWLDHIL